VSENNLLLQASGLYKRGEYSAAIRLYENAREYRTDRLYQAFIDNNIAQCLRRLGYANEGLLEARHGIDRLEGLPVTTTLGEILVTAANCAADLDHHDEALVALRGAADIFTSLNVDESLQQVKVSISRSLAGLQRTDEARVLLVELLKANISPTIRSQVLNNLAVIEQKNDPAVAKALLLRDLHLHETLGDEFGCSVTLINLALLAIDEQSKEEALSLLLSARKAAERVNATDLIARVARIKDRIQ
jgi:tetratricopeptide (TPR) repeat protein